MGIFITHAHEDHIGAIAHLWPQLKCKIFATPFTAVLIKKVIKIIRLSGKILVNDEINIGDLDFIELKFDNLLCFYNQRR